MQFIDTTPLGRALRSRRAYYDRRCEFSSPEKDKHYEKLGGLLGALRDDGFGEIRVVGLPEFRLAHNLSAMARGGSKSQVKSYTGFETSRRKYLDMVDHYDLLSKEIDIPIEIHYGDIVDGFPELDIDAPNVFDFDFCRTPIAPVRKDDEVRRRFKGVPTRRFSVPDLLLAENIAAGLKKIVRPGDAFIFGVNFSTRTLTSRAARRFVDRIVQEVLEPFSSNPYFILPTSYRPYGEKKELVGAWVISKNPE